MLVRQRQSALVQQRQWPRALASVTNHVNQVNSPVFPISTQDIPLYFPAVEVSNFGYI